MQRAIRLMVCVVLAATSAAAFANTRGESEAYDPTMQGENEMQAAEGENELQAVQGQSETQPTERADDGHGSGEPALAASSASAETARIDDKAAIREYNQREFVRGIWAGSP